MKTRLRYFETGVLDQYAREPEKFIVDDTVIGGSVQTRTEYVRRLPNAQVRPNSVSIGYNKRKLVDGRVAIEPILFDWQALPRRHKQHWCSWEIRRPKFSSFDRDYQKAWAQNYGGEFVQINDSVMEVGEIVEYVAARYGIYKRGSNPALAYPFLNNAKSYSESHNELRKLVGPDNMDAGRLSWYLRFFKLTYDENLKTWGLFKQLVTGVCGEDIDRILKPLEKCSKERSLIAHEVQDNPVVMDFDFIYEFRCDCADVADALDRLALRIRWAITRTWQGGN